MDRESECCGDRKTEKPECDRVMSHARISKLRQQSCCQQDELSIRVCQGQRLNSSVTSQKFDQ